MEPVNPKSIAIAALNDLVNIHDEETIPFFQDTIVDMMRIRVESSLACDEKLKEDINNLKWIYELLGVLPTLLQSLDPGQEVLKQ